MSKVAQYLCLYSDPRQCALSSVQQSDPTSRTTKTVARNNPSSFETKRMSTKTSQQPLIGDTLRTTVIGLPEKSMKEKDSGKCLSRAAIFLSTVTIILVVALGLEVCLVVLPALTQPKHILGPQPVDDEPAKPYACIPCIKLLQHPEENMTANPWISKLDIEVHDGREDCCAYTSDQISALFECIVRLNDPPVQHLPSYNVSDFKFSPVSAHKRLYPKRIVRTFGVPEFPERLAVCEFKPDDPQTGLEHTRGVYITEDNTGLRMKYGGLYYIYISIQFRPQSRFPCSRFKYKTFSAYVLRISKRTHGSQIIMKTVHTCCDTCVNEPETRFTAGLFVLEAGDVIRVKVTGFELVYFQPHTTFAGLAMLGNAISDTPETKSEVLDKPEVYKSEAIKSPQVDKSEALRSPEVV